MTVSTYDRVHALVDRLVAAAAEKELSPQHKQLVALIESERHLLIGAKALATHMEQRFTQDTDYLVSRRSFDRVRKWLREQKVDHRDEGDALLIGPLAIDVIDADAHPVPKEVLKHETGIPSSEALAAMKYAAIVSETRDQRKRYSDISDLVGLVTLSKFDVGRFLAFLVERFEEQRPQAGELVERIRRGERGIVF